MATTAAASHRREADVDLTIVIPCLNEEDNVRLVLDELRAVLANRPFVSEIIVVDDFSDDRTFAVAEEWANSAGPDFRISVLKRPLHRRGYGAAVRYGVAYGVGRYAIFVSADGVDPINLIPTMYEKMEEGFAIAQCSRYLRPSDSASIPFKYKFFQFFFRIGVRIALGKTIVDSTYAFKMFRRREMLGVGLTQNRFNISPEIMFKSILGGGRVEYIAGAQGTRQRGRSKFVFHKEGIGFGYCLVRALLHRHKLIYWF